ncbi:hypothetical protein Tco_0185337 [Tanacetum coccineum]
MILAAQGEAFDQENVMNERLHGLDQQMERKRDGSLYFMDRIWVPLVGRSPVLWAEIREGSLIRPELVQETTDKVVAIKERLQAVRDRQKSYADNRLKPFRNSEKSSSTYRLRLPEELSGVHDTFHVSTLKKCLADASLHVPLNEIKVDKTLRFIEEPVEILDHGQLKS